MNSGTLPIVLVIDDLYGRSFADRRNEDREDLCLRMGLRDITGDEEGRGAPEVIPDPLAEVIFCRGQIETGGNVENDLAGAIEMVRRGWEKWPRWALALLDLHFRTGPICPDGEPEGRDSDNLPHQYFGLTILKDLQRQFPNLPVVILSSKDREQVSLDYSNLGAANFLDRNSTNREQLVDNLWRHGLIEDTRQLSFAEEKYRICGHSIPLLLAWREVRRQAKNNGNLFVLGETGTGKAMVASAVHELSSRRNMPFVTINCGALPRELLESELFGHKKGAFTGASEPKLGKFEYADGGTVFLDEIGEMPPDMQVSLLRVLEEREVTPIGGNTPISVDVRVIAATNRDLVDEILNTDFRDDLYYRLSDTVITMPPLRERREDIPLLAQRFLEESITGDNAVSKEISEDAMKLLEEASWPGNVRELRKVIQNAVTRYPDVEYLVPTHLNIEGVYTAPSYRPLFETQEKLPLEDIDSVIRVLDEYDFNGDYADLQGRLADIQDTYIRFFARYLRAALIATLDTSPKHPEGEINFTGALRCITGDSKLTTTNAKRLVARMLKDVFGKGATSEDLGDILEDPFFRAAYYYAMKK